MTRRSWRLVAALVGTASALSLAACGDDDDDTGSEPGPGAYADDYATSSDFFTLMSAPVAGSSPHGTVQIWYSSNIRSDIEDGGSFEAPEGTVSIKEFSASFGDGIVAMIKREPGFDADNGDWEYQMRDLAGTLTGPASPDGCIACHAAAAATDYLAGTTLR